MTELTNDNFEQTVRQEGIVLVDCWAAWCGACGGFEETYETVAARHPKHTFAKLDVGRHGDLCSTLELSHVPSLLLYRDGILLFKESGSFDEATLTGVIEQAEKLDMEMVREELAVEAGKDRTNAT
jgi:thioredoxin 1